ncbi:MAG: hypothetical protein ACK5PF_08010 [bacterium]|jgi:hypothetical protein
MSGGKHTPGPWSAQTNGAQWVVHAGRKQRVASVHTGLVGQEANARLIAAAPDLLAAGRLLLRACDEGDADMAMDGYDLLRAAIAKAEGGAA